MQTGQCIHPLQLNCPGFRSLRHSTPQRAALITANPKKGGEGRGEGTAAVISATQSHSLKLYLRVQWVNNHSGPPSSHPLWPPRCKLISDMKADRSLERRLRGALLSLCRNRGDCMWQRPLLILTQTDISLMLSF